MISPLTNVPFKLQVAHPYQRRLDLELAVATGHIQVARAAGQADVAPLAADHAPTVSVENVFVARPAPPHDRENYFGRNRSTLSV